jgi:hypothetical protein
LSDNLRRLRRAQNIPWAATVFILILAITTALALHFSERSRIEDARSRLLELDARIVADSVEAALRDHTAGARAGCPDRSSCTRALALLAFHVLRGVTGATFTPGERSQPCPITHARCRVR